MNNISIIDNDTISDKIHTIRGLQVMLDNDLAELYGVELKRLNEQVKRNGDRFPNEFMFQLTEEEYQSLKVKVATSSSENSLRSQIATLETARGKHRKYLPYAFTEQGVAMLSSVLNSKAAIQISINIINTFVQMRKIIATNSDLFSKIEQIEKRQISYEIKSDEKFNTLFKAIEEKSPKPKQGIFYDGQVYDAYIFVADLIKNAQESIVLIDNYVDDTVLTLFSKNQNIHITIYTSQISKELKLDFDKYTTQHKNIELKVFKNAHDRFMIIDKREIYHIGASLKDLGKKWFAFSKFDLDVFEMLGKLNG